MGGYGRQELFPYSDVDLLFLLDARVAEKDVKDVIRRLNQEMWDCGIRVSPTTRKIGECESSTEENAEFTVSLMDHRMLAGDTGLYDKLVVQTLPKLLQREQKPLTARLIELTRVRHAKYGDTLFHLEPNIKDCPGGLRDVHVCGWLSALQWVSSQKNEGTGTREQRFRSRRSGVSARQWSFLRLVRCFLHYRHERDDNTLAWQAQDAAAEAADWSSGTVPKKMDAAYWMRLYFRHARSVQRRVTQMMEEASAIAKTPSKLLGLRRERKAESRQRRFSCGAGPGGAGCGDGVGRRSGERSDVVLNVFATMARTGCDAGQGRGAAAVAGFAAAVGKSGRRADVVA